MIWRFTSFMLCQLLGGLIGWRLGDGAAIAAGFLAGGLAWLVLDSMRGLRVLRWLRRGEYATTPFAAGMWGEVVDRVRRALRLREQDKLEAQQRLQEFLAAIQASPDGVVLLDAKGRIEWSNQTAAEQFGFDLARDMQQHVAHLVRDPVFAGYYNSGHWGQEVVIVGPRSSASRPVKLAVHLHPYGEGRKLLLSRDITAVEQADIMRRDFVADVSHEIRTPLTVLMGFVETLQNLPLSEPDKAHYLGLMAQQAQRMHTLVNDLLTLSRLEGSPLPGAGEWISLGTLMVQSEQEARALCSALGKSLSLEFEHVPSIDIAGAQHELFSAISNLVSNAVRYTPASGSIKIQWSSLTDGRVEFSVRDTGPGIAPEHLSRLTERFYRVDRSRSRETGGTGLGLAIVKHVVQRHGAELTIDSTPGVGSSFAIRFPPARVRAAISPDTNARRATESLAESD